MTDTSTVGLVTGVVCAAVPGSSRPACEADEDRDAMAEIAAASEIRSCLPDADDGMASIAGAAGRSYGDLMESKARTDEAMAADSSDVTELAQVERGGVEAPPSVRLVVAVEEDEEVVAGQSSSLRSGESGPGDADLDERHDTSTVFEQTGLDLDRKEASTASKNASCTCSSSCCASSTASWRSCEDEESRS